MKSKNDKIGVYQLSRKELINNNLEYGITYEADIVDLNLKYIYGNDIEGTLISNLPTNSSNLYILANKNRSKYESYISHKIGT